MTYRFARIARKLYPVLAAGVLFQATAGCDTRALTAELLGLIIQNLIASFVFGSFGLVP